MTKKKAIPSIHVPIQTPSGAMDFSWYLFLQWVAENAGQTDLSDYFTKEEVNALLSVKLDQTESPNVLYGTNNNGEQYLYNVSYFAADSGVVHLAGWQQITGTKVFNAPPRFKDNLTPSTTSVKESVIEDPLLDVSLNTSGKIDGANIVRFQLTNGSREVRYRAGFRNSTNTANHWPSIALGVTSGDIQYVDLRNADVDYAKTTSIENESDQIATTSWGHTFAKQYVSNCIIKIPQDIKLELNNGTLKLKAGSKVYVPNGPNVFDTLSVNSDVTIVPTGGSGVCVVCVNSALSAGNCSSINNCVSGPGVTHVDYGLCYDTTTNIIQRWGGGTITYDKASLPIALVTQTNGTITSIDRVFNGFGYIGSSIFCLPDVRILVPDGRGDDGTLKSVRWTSSAPIVRTESGSYSNGVAINTVNGIFGIGNYSYDKVNNLVYIDSAISPRRCMIGAIKMVSGKVSSFEIKQVFHAVDYNDFFDLQEKDSQNVKLYGNQTISGVKTFSGTIVASNKITGSISGNCDGSSSSCTGNAATVTNGVYTTGNQTIGGTKTFSSSPVAPTPSTTDNSTKVPTTSWVRNYAAEYLYTKASNFIVEETQDIKLELEESTGKVTLKSGSKFYVPNGTGTFNAVTTTVDYCTVTSTNNTRRLIYIPATGGFIGTLDANAFYSGNTMPSGTWKIWYDTANNLIKKIEGTAGTVAYTCGFPLGVVTVSGGKITSIDQVFNGFGFIGSTFFALPGLKVACPDGRNSDGSVKNIIATVQSVKTVSNSASGSTTNSRFIMLNSNADLQQGSEFIVRKTEGELTKDAWVRQYCLDSNKIWTWNTTGWLQEKSTLLAYYSTLSSTTQVTSMQKYETLNLLSKNETNFISHQAMPSKKYLDLGTGAAVSGNNYTAPADGWFAVRKTSTAAGQNINLLNNNNGLGAQFVAQGANESPVIQISVQKGGTVNYTTNFGGATQMFRFVYANGDT